MSPSVHQMAAHAWELFEINNGLPISMWAECPGEAWNKYIRAYKSGPACRARQNSIQNNIRYIFPDVNNDASQTFFKEKTIAMF